ncbi:SusC/RagA family TonB-linked outer membrane protein [Chryseobacterium sp. CT-SW4]|uniref:SusC/RagA family TonB-linked outer membrane protein n=1 Tax=Chryseobacterium sp. SW-1 TaxID=3157343 RepID=UPI003B022D5B
MKKLTTSVLLVVVSSSFALVNAQRKENDTIIREQSIGEVVITGALGIQKKADAQTSAIQVVSNEALTAAGNPNAILSLQGKTSGVTINNTNSSVTGSPRIVIRGNRSITGNNQALVVIDNVISSATALQQLPAELIESMNIIKGAQAAALYGSDGVNGVVLVTTKRGSKSNRMNVTFNSVTDFESVAYLPKRQRLYGQGWSGLKVNVENGAWGPAFSSSLGGQTVPYGIPLYDYNNDGIIETNPNDDALTPDDAAAIQSKFAPYGKDNVKDFFKVGTILQNGVTVNVGGENSYLLMSIDNMQREFVVEDDKLNRTSAFLKAGIKYNKWSFDAIVNYTRQKTSTTSSNLYSDLLQSSADIPISLFSGVRDRAYAWNIYYNNPYWYINHVRNNATTNRLNLIGSANYKLNKHIDILYRANVQFNTGESRNWNDGWSDILIPDATSEISSYNQSSTSLTKYYGDLLVNFNYDLTDDLNLKLNVGHNFQNTSYNTTSAGGTGIIIPGLYQIWNLSNPTLPYSLDNTRGSYNSQAVFANLDLSFRDYLFLTATGRNEWNSVLSVNNRSYFYPSVGLSFVPTKAFDFGGETLNYLKVYGSIMGTANASQVAEYAIRNYFELANGFPYTTSGPTGGALSFVIPTTQTNAEIKPEKVSKKEIGINAGLFNNRILLGASIYQDDTRDMIIANGASYASGISLLRNNIGKLRNRGLDADITIVPVKTRDFRWEVTSTFTTFKADILEVSEDADEVFVGGSSLAGVYAVKGEGFVIKGTAYQRDDQGRIIINPNTGNPLYTTTLKTMGRVDPKYAFGFSTNLTYKGIKLSAVADWRIGGKFYAGAMQSYAFSGQLEESAAFDRTQGGFIMPNSVYADASGNYVANTSIKTGGETYDDVIDYYSNVYTQIGENFVKSATFFKIREIALSYTFPSSMLQNSGISGLTIGVHARNPFTKYSKENRNYADPETSFTTGNAQGIAASNQYPAVRTFGFNVNVNF